MIINYKPITIEEAKALGKPAKAIIHGKKFKGYLYEGYFFHRVPTIGNCKMLAKWCEEVREL